MRSQKRALLVCSTCHRCKVRCDYDAASGVCTYCKSRDLQCELRIRKPYSSTKRRAKKAARSREQTTPPILDHHSDTEEAISTVITSAFERPGKEDTPIYAGKSGYGTLLDILEPGKPKPRHITIRSATDSNLGEDELRYLQSKGCFELPKESEALLDAYFKFIHPLFPVLDAPSFLAQYNLHGLKSVNLLLLWSMFSASSSFVPSVASSEIRSKFHTRGCVLFHHGGETDKLILTQAALLLSFWFDDASDVKQSWYWSGIAFSLAQSLGLHDSTTTRKGEALKANYHLQEDIWHCCLYRDGWLSYSMGRPLRLLDRNRPSRRGNRRSRFKEMCWHDTEMYNTKEADFLDIIWEQCVNVAQVLRQAQFSPYLHEPSASRPVRKLSTLNEEYKESLSISLSWRHLQLCKNAATIAISHLQEDKDDMSAAADEMAAIAKQYIDDGIILTFPPTFVPLVMPAILVSMSGMETTDKVIRNRHESRLQSCLQGLTHAELSYPAATIAKRLFSKAYSYIVYEKNA